MCGYSLLDHLVANRDKMAEDLRMLFTDDDPCWSPQTLKSFGTLGAVPGLPLEIAHEPPSPP